MTNELNDQHQNDYPRFKFVNNIQEIINNEMSNQKKLIFGIKTEEDLKQWFLSSEDFKKSFTKIYVDYKIYKTFELCLYHCYQHTEYLIKEFEKYRNLFIFEGGFDYLLTTKPQSQEINITSNTKQIIFPKTANIPKSPINFNLKFTPKNNHLINLPIIDKITEKCNICSKVFFVSLMRNKLCNKCKKIT